MTNSNNNKFAKESEKTKQAREKLLKKLEAIEKKMTPDALEKKLIDIHDRISRHAPSRIALKNKSICLFDNNQNSAELSKKIIHVFEKIKQESFSKILDSDSLTKNVQMKHKVSFDEPLIEDVN
ncbi:MAG: hypothetical protein JXA94_00730 [Parachlamydiales bacterium]|nr:hypothetical protein [Parachlamydiales bacterium]